MDSILAFVTSYFTYWPLVCVIALILAGFNLPVSEDILIVMSALISHEDPSMLIPNYVGLYIGIYVSDMISYWMGRLLGMGVLKLKFITKALSPARVEKISKRLERNGFLTFVVTRFIPFGMRNALFMTSGFIKLSFLKFLLFDCFAAFFSSMTLYALVLYLGESAQQGFKIVGIVLFVLVWGGATAFIIRKIVNKRKAKKQAAAEKETAEDSDGSDGQAE